MANGEYIGSNSKIIKNLNMFIGTLSEIKSKETKGQITYLEFLFSTDTKEFYLGSRSGKAICFGTGSAVNEDVIREIVKEASANELQNIKNALSSILSSQITDEIDSLTSGIKDSMKLLNDNQIKIKEKLDNKQDLLIAGEGIEISNNIISATGSGSGDGKITATDMEIEVDQYELKMDIVNDNFTATQYLEDSLGNIYINDNGNFTRNGEPIATDEELSKFNCVKDSKSTFIEGPESIVICGSLPENPGADYGFIYLDKNTGEVTNFINVGRRNCKAIHSVSDQYIMVEDWEMFPSVGAISFDGTEIESPNIDTEEYKKVITEIAQQCGIETISENQWNGIFKPMYVGTLDNSTKLISLVVPSVTELMNTLENLNLSKFFALTKYAIVTLDYADSSISYEIKSGSSPTYMFMLNNQAVLGYWPSSTDIYALSKSDITSFLQLNNQKLIMPFNSIEIMNDSLRFNISYNNAVYFVFKNKLYKIYVINHLN